MKTKLAKRDVNLILIALSVVLLVTVYFMYYISYTTQADDLDNQSDELRILIDELREHETQLPLYTNTLAETQAFVEEELALYRSWVDTSDLIMYAVSIENTLTAVSPAISSVSFTEPALIHSAFFLDEDGIRSSIDFYSVSMSMNVRLSYDEMKTLVASICDADDRTLLEAMSLSYDAERGLLNATLTLKKVFLPFNGTNPTDIPVPSGPVGTQNPFSVRNVPVAVSSDVETVDEGAE